MITGVHPNFRRAVWRLSSDGPGGRDGHRFKSNTGEVLYAPRSSVAFRIRGLLDRKRSPINQNGGHANCIDVSELPIAQKIAGKFTLPGPYQILWVNETPQVR